EQLFCIETSIWFPELRMPLGGYLTQAVIMGHADDVLNHKFSPFPWEMKISGVLFLYSPPIDEGTMPGAGISKSIPFLCLRKRIGSGDLGNEDLHQSYQEPQHATDELYE